MKAFLFSLLSAVPRTLAACLLLVLAAGCGPAGLTFGLVGLADDDDVQRVVVLLFVNNSGETVQLDLTADAVSGTVVTLPSQVLPPAAVATINVPESRCVRVRGCELAVNPGRAPLTWDYDVVPSANGSATVSTLGRQAAVLSALHATTSAGERIDLQTLVTGGSQPAFERISLTEIGFAPDRVVLHPSGGYLYTLRDLGMGNGEIQAFRVDSATGAVESIGSEFGLEPTNPRPFTYQGSVDDVDLFVEPLGRAAYVVDRDASAFRSDLAIYPLEVDGTLGTPSTGMRGLIGDLEFRRDGAFVALSENFGDAQGFMVRVLQVTATGLPGLLVSETQMPCVNTNGGALALHPSGSFVYVAFRDDPSDLTKVGAYFLGSSGEFFLVNSQCSDFRTIRDLTFDPAGAFLYVTGTNLAGQDRVIRYPLDPVTGALGTADTSQNLGAVTNCTATADPNAPAGDPLRNIVHIAIGDSLVPHTVDPSGALQPLPGSPSLPYGSPSSTRQVTGTERGTVQLSSQ